LSWLVRCWEPQVGVVTLHGVCNWLPGVCSDIVMETGVRTLVGVRPVRPSIRLSKLRLEKTLVGVSMGTPSMERRHCGLIDKLRVAGRVGAVVTAGGNCSGSGSERGISRASSWVR